MPVPCDQNSDLKIRAYQNSDPKIRARDGSMPTYCPGELLRRVVVSTVYV